MPVREVLARNRLLYAAGGLGPGWEVHQAGVVVSTVAAISLLRVETILASQGWLGMPASLAALCR